MKDYISNLYKVLFEFDFSGIKDSTTMPRAVLTILWTSLFLFVVKNINLGGFWGDFKFLSGMIFYLIGMYFVWFFTAIFFEFVMKIFGKAGKIRTLLTLSSYCLLPYIFIAPFELMKKFSDLGYFFGTKFELLLFFWVILLYARSLKETYDIENSSSYMLVFLPFVTFVFSLMWVIGSIFNLGYIYNV